MSKITRTPLSVSKKLAILWVIQESKETEGATEEGLTTEDIANRVNLSPDRARRYLEQLYKEKFVGRTITKKKKKLWLPFQRRERRGGGRPPYRYMIGAPDISDKKWAKMVQKAFKEITPEMRKKLEKKEYEISPETLVKFIRALLKLTEELNKLDTEGSTKKTQDP